MTGKTTIEWTAQPGYVGAVWNPTVGCTRVSAGCDNCYAFELHDRRFKGQLAAADIEASHYIGGDPVPTKSVEVPAWVRAHGGKLPLPKQYDLPFSRVQLLEQRLAVPLRTHKPTCYFVDSMADLFHEDVPDLFIGRVFNAMGNATLHRFLVLTKRPERMSDLVRRYYDSVPRIKTPFPNVWLGTSVEDQRAADERIPHLLATPAAVRFLSCEPLLGPVDLSFWLMSERCQSCGRTYRDVWWADDDEWARVVGGPGGLRCPSCYVTEAKAHGIAYPAMRRGDRVPSVDWVIAGGESGNRARPMDLAWARSLRDQCRSAGVAFFMKQLGSKPSVGELSRTDEYAEEHARGEGRLFLNLRESHGRNPDEWPEDLRVREWPR